MPRMLCPLCWFCRTDQKERVINGRKQKIEAGALKAAPDFLKG